MTPRERLFTRLQGQPVDRAPNLAILMQFAARFIGQPFDVYCRDYRVMVEGNLRCNDVFGIDLLSTMSDAYRETADYGADVTFPADSLPLCKAPLLGGPEDFGKLRRFDPWQSVRMRDRLQAVALYKQEAGDTYPILGWVEGPIAEMSDLRGLSETLMDLYEEPAFVEDVFNLCTEQAIDCARAQVAAGADIIGVGDAAASLLSAELYTAHVLPFEQRLIAAVHATGAKVKLHICGDITHLLDQVWRSGADIIDADWMVDIRRAAACWPQSTVLNGNFDPVAVMLQGTPEDVKHAAWRNLREGGDRLCVSPGCEVPLGTPDANLQALHEALCAGVAAVS
ncbi:MAG TPA: uroporphyrinogen decarboxylase family protein [Armatimonadota bacterium]|jgi:MtaA/CmuA family methyltransferase